MNTNAAPPLRHFERSEAESRNLPAKVSCRDEYQWCRAGEETLCKQFPAVMNINAALPLRHFERSEAESRNLPAKVSCRDEYQWCRAGEGTLRE